MNTNNLLRKTSFTTFLFVFTFLLVIISCSTDEIKDPALQESDMEEMQEPEDENKEDENEEPSNLPISGKIEFEEGFILEKERMFVNHVLPQGEYEKFITGDGDIEMVTSKIYDYFNDDFDFVIILSVEETQPDDLFYGRSHPVQNQVQGLGIGTYDNSGSFGSAGKLKSVIYMPRTEYVRNGPFLHEIVHSWANKGIIPTTVGGHWGFASTGGQLGGFDELVDMGGGNYKGRLFDQDGFGTFANGGNGLPYGNLELYLMGLIGAAELETVQVAVNPEYGSAAGEFTADQIDSYTAADLINEHGARIPSVEDSQKSFRALTVIISTAAVDQSKIDSINLNLENFSRASAPDSNWGSLNNFWMATQAKASFEFVVLQESLK